MRTIVYQKNKQIHYDSILMLASYDNDGNLTLSFADKNSNDKVVFQMNSEEAENLRKRVKVKTEESEKAKKYDELEAKIAEFYPEDEDEENEDDMGLIAIGEIAAMHFGFL